MLASYLTLLYMVSCSLYMVYKHVECCVLEGVQFVEVTCLQVSDSLCVVLSSVLLDSYGRNGMTRHTSSRHGTMSKNMHCCCFALHTTAGFNSEACLQTFEFHWPVLQQ